MVDSSNLSRPTKYAARKVPGNARNPPKAGFFIGMLICPICWVERQGSAMPDYGANASPVPMLLRADKILDY